MIEARKRAENGETGYSYEYRIIRPDSEIRTLRNTILVAAREEDGMTHRTGTVQDITEQVRTDEHLRQAMKMEAVGQLTGGVAHDFNNLLTVMLGNLELIRDKVEADDSLKGMIERGIKAAERGAALTSRLLAFSRKQTLLPTAVDLNKLVTDMTDMLSRALGETIEIRTSVPSNLWKCLVDGSQLENALLNLSINARDAMSDGGMLNIEMVNIILDDKISAAQAEVDLGQYVVLSVSDTGSGMSKETLAHAVEPFFTTKEVGKGSGLGLSMVYGFAKQSGGNATIHSAPGDGTTVKLYLPRSSAQNHPAASSAPASDSPSARGENILVVEDDPEVRALTVAVLSGLGYEIAEAGSAEEALDIFHHCATIDLLLSDVVLPGAMNGPHLAAEIERRSPVTKVIFMTGYAEEAFSGGAGADESTIVIQKPFSKADLARTIRNLLDDGIPRSQPTPSPSAVH